MALTFIQTRDAWLDDGYAAGRAASLRRWSWPRRGHQWQPGTLIAVPECVPPLWRTVWASGWVAGWNLVAADYARAYG